MTHQTRKLPEDDREMLIAWELFGKSYAAVSRAYDCNEASVRKRMKRIWDGKAMQGLPSRE